MEQVGIKLTLDGAQADTAMNRIRQGAVTLGGGLEKLDRASMAAAKGIGAMGPALGALSRSSSEVLRGLGDVAGLLTGGAFAVGVGLAVAGVVKLHDEFTKLDRQAAAAFRGMREAANREVEATIRRIASLEEKLAGFGKSGAQQTRDTAFDARQKALTDETKTQQTLLGIQESIAETERLRAETLRSYTGKTEQDAELSRRKQQLADLNRMKQAEEERLRAIRERLPLLAREAELAQQYLKKETDAANDASADAAVARLKAQWEAEDKAAEARAQSKREAAENKVTIESGSDDAFVHQMEADEIERQEKHNLKMIELEEKKQADLLALKKEAGEKAWAVEEQMLNEQLAQSKRQREETVQQYAALTGGIAAATGTLAADLVTGQEDAWGKFLAGAAQQAGAYITLEGGKVLATGIGGALVGNPAAPLQIAGGLGLIAAGAAVSAGGAAAVQSLAGGFGGGGGGGSSSGSRIRTEPGINRGRGGGSSSSNNEPTVINITYSAAGPRPEDTGRAVDYALRTHRKRQGVAP